MATAIGRLTAQHCAHFSDKQACKILPSLVTIVQISRPKMRRPAPLDLFENG